MTDPARPMHVALTLVALLTGFVSVAHAQPVVFADGLEDPRGLTQLADGRVLVTEFQGNAVAAFAADGTPVGTFASGIDDPVPIRQLADGRVLVGEFNEGVIRAFGADGTDLGVFASDLEGPVDITQLADGTVLVSETYTPSARAFSADGEDLGPYVTSVTDSGAAFGTAQLADGRIVMTVSGPFEALQLFSAAGGFQGTLVRAGEGLDSVGSVRQLADGRIAVLDATFGEVATFTTAGESLGVVATIPNLLSDFVQLADGRLLVADVDEHVYQIAVMSDGEAGTDGLSSRLDISPNPTRGTATLRVTFSAPGPVRVTVHDLLGRRVAVVHDGPLAAGTHALRWNSAHLPVGAYLARATANGSTVTRRLTVVR